MNSTNKSKNSDNEIRKFFVIANNFGNFIKYIGY